MENKAHGRPVGKRDALWKEEINLTGCRRADGADADKAILTVQRRPGAVPNLERGIIRKEINLHCGKTPYQRNLGGCTGNAWKY
jgi:hypothetical protein